MKVFCGRVKMNGRVYEKWRSIPEELTEYVLWMIDLGYAPKTICNYVQMIKAGKARGLRSYERFKEWKRLYNWSPDDVDLDKYLFKDYVIME